MGMHNINIDCNIHGSGGCDYGLYLQHVYRSHIADISCTNATISCINNVGFSSLPSGVYIGSCANIFDNVTITESDIAGANGISIGNSDTTTGANSFDVCREIFNDLEVVVSPKGNAKALLIRGSDLITFNGGVLTASTPGPTGYYAIYVAPPSGNSALPSNYVFNSMAIVGAVFTPSDGSWNPKRNFDEGLSFNPLPIGDMLGAGISPYLANRYGGIHGWLSNGMPWEVSHRPPPTAALAQLYRPAQHNGAAPLPLVME